MPEKHYRPTNRKTQVWASQFGDEYIERNDFAPEKQEQGVSVFGRVLKGLKFESVLEVGSNIGLNLHFIHELFKDRVKLFAVEPNRKAYDKLLSQNLFELEKVWNCDVFQMPIEDSAVDLVFTSGVLIHIAPDDLGRATDEIVRISRKYILCIEYFSHVPEEIPYRGKTGLLFKRDFGGYYLDRFPELKWINYGFIWQREFPIFDDLTWWLFEKERA